jgi:hypothetical protein
MRRILTMALAGAVMALGVGCATGPMFDNPVLVVPGLNGPTPQANPVYVPPHQYAFVYENVLKVLADYGFDIMDANRYDGRIETVPRIAPGLGLFLKSGSPDPAERLLATLQTYRHRILVSIQPADNGGFFIQVVAYKELEDLPRPTRQTAGAAIFRNDNNVARQYEVVDPRVIELNWIPKGRDLYLEQAILQQIKSKM